MLNSELDPAMAGRSSAELIPLARSRCRLTGHILVPTGTSRSAPCRGTSLTAQKQLVDTLIGTTVQHYRIGERLGAGGMGEVYRAEDIRLGRPVALKFLPPSLKADPESRARLLNEARAASMLRSPNIAVTYDIGEDGGTDFIVMEYVDGELLSSRVGERAAAGARSRRNRPPGRRRARRSARARDHASRHQEREPDADRARPGQGARLRAGEVRQARRRRRRDVTQPQVTMAGMVVGTVSYMAPEQALGRPVDHRADLFSLGVVLFELATGRMPFDGGSPTEIIDHILHETPPPPSRYAPACRRRSTPSWRARSRSRRRSATSPRATCSEDLRQVAERARRAAARHDEPRRRRPAVDGGAVERSVAVMTFANITREPADDWIGTGIAETVSSDLKNIHGLTHHRPRARLRRAAQPHHPIAHLNDSLAIDIGRRLGATWVVVGGFQRHRRARADHRELRRRRDRRGAADGQGRRPHRRHLRAAGQDRLRAQPGAEPRAARHRDRRHREARDPLGRGLRELRARA